jgi:hypothetical protein
MDELNIIMLSEKKKKARHRKTVPHVLEEGDP